MGGGGFVGAPGQSARAREGGAGRSGRGRVAPWTEGPSRLAVTEPQLHLQRLQSRAQPPRRSSVKLSETDALSWDFFFFFALKVFTLKKLLLRNKKKIGTDGVSASPPIPLLPRSSSHPETPKMNTEPAAAAANPARTAGRKPRETLDGAEQPQPPGGRGRCRPSPPPGGLVEALRAPPSLLRLLAPKP